MIETEKFKRRKINIREGGIWNKNFSKEMMYCSECGEKLKDGLKFCTRCGVCVSEQWQMDDLFMDRMKKEKEV